MWMATLPFYIILTIASEVLPKRSRELRRVGQFMLSTKQNGYFSTYIIVKFVKFVENIDK